MNMKVVGAFIAERRKELHMTQEELGNLLCVTSKAVSKWERGISCPDVELMGSLAPALKCSIAELTNGRMKDFAKSSSLSDESECVDEQQKCQDGCHQEVNVQYDFSSQISVSPYLFGNNLEHTRSSIHRGLSAQMLKNRKFAGKPERNGAAHEWYPIGEKTFVTVAVGTESYMGTGTPYTRHGDSYHMKREHECNAQVITDFTGQEESGIGQHELFVQKNVVYEFRMAAVVYQDTVIRVSITGRNGGQVYAEGEIVLKKTGEEYQTAQILLASSASDADADLRITFVGKGTVMLGVVSLMPQDNFRGLRKDVIEQMKEIGIKLLRWPGGNFAGEYNWKDGLLPVDMRAPFESYMGIETQPHSMGYDFHEMNTDDFVALCREIGAEPFITINPAWNTPQESAQWVEYCNGDETTEYGRLRIERGYKKPYQVQFWSLGNEMGYGHMEGDNTSYGYSRIAGEHAREMLKVSSHLTLCSSGPYPNEDWVEHAAKPLQPLSSLISLHHYSRYPAFMDPAKQKEEYEKNINTVDTQCRVLLHKLRSQLNNDSIRISFDEWNAWYAWYRPGSVCEGIFAAAMFHMLIREAEPMGMDIACHFEAVNEGAIKVEPDRAYLTPMGQMFAVMKEHIGGKLLFASDAAVATDRDDILTVTLVNRSYDECSKITLPALGKVTRAKWYGSEDVVPFSEFKIQDIKIQDIKVQENNGDIRENEMRTAEVCRVDEELQILLPEHSVLLVQMKH